MLNINWLDEVTKRQDDLLADLFRLLKIDSVRNDDLATEEAPVGPGPLKALEEFLRMAEEDGFKTQQFGPWAGRIELGQGEELMGILGHLDVVPAGSGWDTDPFEPVIKDGRIYGRGSSDDKGPTVAAYFAIKLLREFGHEFNKRLHLIVGTDEETGWACMDYYFQHAEMPDFGFSPDADFPIINGEKGNVSALFSVLADEDQEGQVELLNFQAGLRPNMVPESAKASVKIIDLGLLEKLKQAKDFADFLNEHGLAGTANLNGQQLDLEVIGKSAHGSTPEKGINGATYLAKFLSRFTYNKGQAQDFIYLLANELHQGFDGSKVGVAHQHPVMGEVSMNIGIANYMGQELLINANFRYPEGTEPNKMLQQMQEALASYKHLAIEMGKHKVPHYVPADDPLVETLLDVYHKQTGLPAHEQSIGGGTYGRLMPRGVAYGALFPDSIDTMHQANEFLALDDLLRATAIYAEAIYRLTK